jgi:protein-disulfide isomerase
MVWIPLNGAEKRMNDQSQGPKQNFSPKPVASIARIPWRWLGGLLVLALILGAAWVLWPKSSASQNTSANLNNEPFLGPADAPVTLIEYGDFGCTTCRGWYNAGVLDKLRAAYGDKLRFVWRDFPIITAQSPKAAEAGQCAFDQGKFWQYHDLLYQRAPALSISDLKSYAAELGLDTARFNQCLDSGEKAAIVEKSKQDAQQRGFTATPDFLLNGEAIIGPPSFADLQTRINAILASQG